jgi:Flp pilus assembly protein TadG
MHRFRRLYKNEAGQSIVEAAFVIPLFILILCGILDFGWIFTNQLMVNNCSREGARYAVVHSDEMDLTSLITSRVLSTSGIMDTTNLTVDVQFVGSEDIKVTVTNRIKVLTPIAGIFVAGQDIELTSACVMRFE